MSQISPPVRILLAASLVLMTAWFLFLRPGTEPVEPQPAASSAPASGLGNAVDGAQNAAAATEAKQAATNAQGEATEGSAPATTGTTGTATIPAGKSSAAAKPADDGRASELGLPASVAKALAQKKVMVMLFWNKNAIDDQAVRRELRQIDRKKGKVKVHVASIKDVARYAPITRGVNLEQSPTIVVVKGDTADTLVGYVDSASIDQTVSDVMRSKR
jgi:hypothetical protein